jgi:hypothetical protein
MSRFRAERLIYGKLAGIDREHLVVGQSVHWPSEGGVPKCVGLPGDSSFQGACSLDWHQCGKERMLALSWCEPGPRITSRDFFQVHHLVARPDEFAHVLPFLPAIVAWMRQIPIFFEIDLALPPFVFDDSSCAMVSATDEVWFRQHWHGLSAVLTALLGSEAVYIRSNANVGENIKIIAGLMLIIPPHLRAHLTFSTDEYALRPYRRRVTFSPNNWAASKIDWQACLTNDPRHSVTHPLVAEFGSMLAKDGLVALLAETRRPEYRHLSFDVAASTHQVQVMRFPSTG